jgi:TP53 regulating kinase and related kinases
LSVSPLFKLSFVVVYTFYNMSFTNSDHPDWICVSQGAEARLYKAPAASFNQHNVDFVIVKERLSKAYRHPQLDQQLTRSRTKAEARCLNKCRDLAEKHNNTHLRVPRVYKVEGSNLMLEYIEGITLRQALNEQLQRHDGYTGGGSEVATENGSANQPNGTDNDTEISSTTATKVTDTPTNSLDSTLLTWSQQLARAIGTLHDWNMVHGDLTTSNVLVHNDSLVLIDFGLASTSGSHEDKAVDLYVLERALQATHPDLPVSFLDDFYKVYLETTQSQATLTRLEKVRQRGRKRDCIG